MAFFCAHIQHQFSIDREDYQENYSSEILPSLKYLLK